LKKILSYTGVLLTALAFFLMSFEAEEDGLIGRLFKAINRFNQQFPQEKIYVHFNKPVYAVGETVWYKVYQVSANSHVPNSLSAVVYLDFYDHDEKLEMRRRVEMDQGYGSGSFTIPSSIQAGKHTIKAFTSWMLNFDPELLFTAEIDIIKPGSTSTTEQKASEPDIDLQFFPEGGYCADGLLCRMGFKASDRLGKGVSISGKIIDSQGNVITSFESLKFGMGSFFFTPLHSEKYTALISGDDDSALRYDLPTISKDGFAMRVNHIGRESIQVAVSATEAHKKDDVTMVLTSGNEIKYSAKGKLVDGVMLINFPKNQLPTGICQITLFNKDGLPELERLIFIRAKEDIRLELKTDKNIYGLRDKVKVRFSAYDSGYFPAKINFSVTVIDKDQIPLKDEGMNIRNYFWLTSELKGQVESPGYYFDQGNEKALEALDNLLLTQGWRRYTWKDLLNDDQKSAPYILEEKGFTLYGQLIDSITSEPIRDSRVFASSPEMPSFFEYTLTDNFGRFSFLQLNFFGDQQLVFSVNDTLPKHRNAKFVINEGKIDFHKKYNRDLSNTHTDILMENLRTRKIIEEVYGKYTDPPGNSRQSDNDLLVGSINPDTTFLIPDRIIDMDDYVELPTIKEVFRELLHGVRLRDRDGYNEIRVMVYVRNVYDGSTVLRYFDKGPLMLVDNIPVFNTDVIVSMDPNVVDQIEIVYGKQNRFKEKILDRTAFDGILHFHMNDDVDKNYMSPKYYQGNVSGFDQYKEFYSPDYQKDKRTRIPDFRENLFWKPKLVTDENGDVEFEFYTSDLASDYLLIVEGISSRGNPIYERLSFKVENDRIVSH